MPALAGILRLDSVIFSPNLCQALGSFIVALLFFMIVELIIHSQKNKANAFDNFKVEKL